MYVSDYISKPALKTYLIFEAVKSGFDRNSEMLEGSLDQKEKTHILLTQIVNNFTSKIEIGGPMTSMYLLKNPDHYTNFELSIGQILYKLLDMHGILTVKSVGKTSWY